jgi:hypothetical protein
VDVLHDPERGFSRGQRVERLDPGSEPTLALGAEVPISRRSRSVGPDDRQRLLDDRLSAGRAGSGGRKPIAQQGRGLIALTGAERRQEQLAHGFVGGEQVGAQPGAGKRLCHGLWQGGELVHEPRLPHARRRDEHDPPRCCTRALELF